MEVLRCKTVDGVLKELHIFALVYNLARVVLSAAARRQGLPIARLSFIDAVRWLRSAKVGERLAKLVVNLDRPDRVEPRVKRRPKEYDRMTLLGPAAEAVAGGEPRREGGDQETDRTLRHGADREHEGNRCRQGGPPISPPSARFSIEKRCIQSYDSSL
jgi:hypothetical protein